METIERGSVLKSPMKLGIAALAAVGLAFGAMSPAAAVDYQLGPEEIAGHVTYDDEGLPLAGWQITSNSDAAVGIEDSLDFTSNACSVTVLESVNPDQITEVFSIFPASQQLAASVTENPEALRPFLESISIDFTGGEVHLGAWIATFYEDSDTGDHYYVWDGPEGTTDALTASGSIPGADVDLIIEWFAEDIEEFNDEFLVIGAGFAATAGTVVNSMSFGGDTYYFGAGDCLPIAPVVPGPAAPTPPKAVETARQ